MKRARFLLLMAAMVACSHPRKDTVRQGNGRKNAPPQEEKATPSEQGYTLEVGGSPSQGITVRFAWDVSAPSVRLSAAQNALQKAKESIVYVKAACGSKELPVEPEAPGVWVTTTDGCRHVTWEWRVVPPPDGVREVGGSFLLEGDRVFLAPAPLPKKKVEVSILQTGGARGYLPLKKRGSSYKIKDFSPLFMTVLLVTDRAVERYGSVIGVDASRFDVPPGAGSFAGRIARVLDGALSLLGDEQGLLVIAQEGEKLSLHGKGSMVEVTRPASMPLVSETRAIRRIAASVIRGLLWEGNEKDEVRWWTVGGASYIARVAMERSGLIDRSERLDLLYWEVLRPIPKWVKYFPQPLTELGAHMTKSRVAKMVAAGGTAVAFYLERQSDPGKVARLIASTPRNCASKWVFDAISQGFSPTTAAVVRDAVTQRGGISQISLDTLRCSVEEVHDKAGALGMRWGIRRGMALVADVYDGPAKQGGIESGDELLRVGDRWILSRGSLVRALVPKPDEVRVLVRRGGSYPRLRVRPGISKKPPKIFVCE